MDFLYLRWLVWFMNHQQYPPMCVVIFGFIEKRLICPETVHPQFMTAPFQSPVDEDSKFKDTFNCTMLTFFSWLHMDSHYMKTNLSKFWWALVTTNPISTHYAQSLYHLQPLQHRPSLPCSWHSSACPSQKLMETVELQAMYLQFLCI